MKELIPLKKDIIFKSKISEVTSIDVEENHKIKDNTVNGNIIISGTYKMTEASLIEEDFYYEVPYQISIGDDVLKDTINIEIDDFKYDYVKDIMSINASLLFTCDKKEESIPMDVFDNLNNEDYFKEENEINDNNVDVNINTNIDTDISDNIINNSNNKTTNINEEVNNIGNEEISNLTNNIVNKENYNIYKVYIVRDNDTIDGICQKYNVKYDDIKDYNDLSNVSVGDKIIIPYINE